MAKLSNTSKGDLIFPGGVLLVAGASNVEVDDEIVDTWGGDKNKVIKGWIDDGKLVVGDYQPLDEDEGPTATDYSKSKKDELMDLLDERGIDFDEKGTKADFIALLEEDDAKKAASE